MRVLLIATYEMGRQPFGLASPAAWLRQAGMTVVCQDLSRSRLDRREVAAADLVALYVPMHTATRIAAHVVQHVKTLNPRAHVCCYGLYAPMNEAFLRSLGTETILGGEFEAGLLALAQQLHKGELHPDQQLAPVISLARQLFVVPDRQDLPPPSAYASLILGPDQERRTGYTEASRGCKHLCRHCPIVPVYEGRFRLVPQDIVLADIRQQVAAGAEHITFGDPDFFNGPGHAIPLVRALHEAFPALTYDVTIKIEHLLRHAEHLPTLRETGCVLVTSAVESVQDHVLHLLDKGHTRQDFITALELCQQVGLPLHPTFVAFTPWTSLADYIELLSVLASQDVLAHVAPIQLAMRLLLPAGSKLLDVPAMQPHLRGFDASALTYRWEHPDARMDQLCDQVLALVQQGQADGLGREALVARLWSAAHIVGDLPVPSMPAPAVAPRRGPIPYLNEPWYC